MRICIVAEGSYPYTMGGVSSWADDLICSFPEHEFVPSIKDKLMFTHFLNILATVISVVSLLIVTYGALVAFISFLGNELKRFTGQYSTVNIRRLRAELGTYLLLGLELLIASDILETVLEPSLDELAILGGIVVLRTILSVFLNKEIKELDNEKEAS